MLSIVINGALGQMGRTLAACAVEQGFGVSAGVDRYAAGAKCSFPLYELLCDCREQADVLVDFSRPDALEELLSYALERRLPLVLATTGYTAEQEALVQQAAKELAVFRTANMSLGVNVLLEKPMCVTTEEAVEIMRAEKKSGKVLSIGFQPRFDENMQMIKKIVDSGVLGKIYYIQTGGGRRRGIPNSTFIEKSTGGIGAMGDIGCYSLDCVLNAIGYPKPLTVTGYTSNYFGTSTEYQSEADAKRFNVDDFAAAFVRLEGGIILDFRIAWAMHLDTPGDSIIMGTKGSLRIPSTDCWNGTVGGPMTIYHDVAGAQTQTTIPVIESKGPGLFDRKIRSFLDAVKDGTPAPVPTSQILYNQAIIDGINKSAALGKEIEVDIHQLS